MFRNGKKEEQPDPFEDRKDRFFQCKAERMAISMVNDYYYSTFEKITNKMSIALGKNASFN